MPGALEPRGHLAAPRWRFRRSGHSESTVAWPERATLAYVRSSPGQHSSTQVHYLLLATTQPADHRHRHRLLDPHPGPTTSTNGGPPPATLHRRTRRTALLTKLNSKDQPIHHVQGLDLGLVVRTLGQLGGAGRRAAAARAAGGPLILGSASRETRAEPEDWAARTGHRDSQDRVDPWIVLSRSTGSSRCSRSMLPCWCWRCTEPRRGSRSTAASRSTTGTSARGR